MSALFCPVPRLQCVRGEAGWSLAVFYSIVESPVGQLLLAGERDSLHQLSFLARRDPDKVISPKWTHDESYFTQITSQLKEYFDGIRREFDIHLDIGSSRNSFSRLVWSELRKIPYGETCSYRTIAERIGRPKAYRAVGQANHHNPIAIIIPCHRVIGSNGTLTGFGGGLDTKRFLLDLEQSR